MGKLVVTEFVSVDGVFEDPGGSESFEHGGWTFCTTAATRGTSSSSTS
jgi:radical SAM superfamily enzyme